jgi:hypothetical protein
MKTRNLKKLENGKFDKLSYKDLSKVKGKLSPPVQPPSGGGTRPGEG